jgi:hypothetical protein
MTFFVSSTAAFKTSLLHFLMILTVVLFIGMRTNAQQFGANPGSKKWQQINTDTARIIFPEGLQATASRVASVIHELQQNHTASIGSKLRKINIVLHNETTFSNAYVGLGPYRSEFYLMPPQNSFELGGLNWADNLSLHEYRHVQQYSNFNKGIAKVFSILFGQQGQDIANAAAVPNYFFEGDAVFNETSLSRFGRGRVPNFFSGFQSLHLQHKDYRYMKLRNGSLRDFVPDHYELGYILVSYGREKYGADFWHKVTQDAVRFKPLIYPWQGAIKRFSGVPYKQFVSDAFSFYQQKWSLTKDAVPSTYISPKAKAPTDYKNVYASINGDIIILKRGYRNVPAFYSISNTGIEKKIATRDIAYDDYFSYNNGKIVYAAYHTDKRWGYREFSNVYVMDANTGQRKKITTGERYFSPDISHDGTKIAAVNMRTNQASEIEVMDLDGKKITQSAAKRGITYTYPKFSANDEHIYSLTRNEDGQMALVKLNISTGKQQELIPYANRIYAFPAVQGDTIFFSSAYKGRDEIWAFVESANAVFRVASHATGLYQAVFDRQRNQLVASNFTADGYALLSIPTTQLLWQKVDISQNALPDLYVPKALQQENAATLEKINTRRFATRKYHKSHGLFNLHSWRPSYDQPEYAFTIFGENVLNTLQTELSYTFNENERSHRAKIDAIYGGWYIQPTIGASQTWNRSIVYNRDTSFHFNELNANIGARLPLNFSGGRQYRFLTLSGTLNHQQVNWTGIAKNLLRTSEFNYAVGRIAYSGQMQKAVQQVFPHWGQSVAAQYRSAVSAYTANQLLLTGALFLPGISVNHSIVVTAAYQQRDTMAQYRFSNDFPFSRGYSAVDFPRMWRLGVNYHLPLFYPDFGVANILYLQRVRANAFYDATSVKSLRTGVTFPFQSVGGELYVDTKWWNQQPVSFGIRYSYLLNQENTTQSTPHQWEIILPVSLFN